MSDSVTNDFTNTSRRNPFKCKPPEVHFTIRNRVPYNKQLTNRACSSRTGERLLFIQNISPFRISSILQLILHDEPTLTIFERCRQYFWELHFCLVHSVINSWAACSAQLKRILPRTEASGAIHHRIIGIISQQPRFLAISASAVRTRQPRCLRLSKLNKIAFTGYVKTKYPNFWLKLKWNDTPKNIARWMSSTL